MNVKDKIIVITGGASGIGFGCAEQFLLHNAKFIAIFDLPSQNAENAVTKLKNQFGQDRADFFCCDVTKNEQVESSFKKVVESFGSFDILVNSAGLLTDVKWELMMNVNIIGVTRTTLKAIDLIGKHNGGKGGTIVNIASIAGLTPVQFLPLYGSTKYAVVGLTSSLALSYKTTGIRMMLMCPGVTTTPLTAVINDNIRFSFIKVDETVKDAIRSSQSPECVTKAMIQLIEKGENGAACVVYNSNPPYLVDIPTINNLVNHAL